MPRTWPVRFSAMEFTLSVRSRHVPATPGTCAWPPSLPSVPTSRATRVTSSAKDRSWSTIRLIVSLSSRTSPRTSTVIFWDRSPRATAVVTSAMLRTWLVRLPAMKFTFSVRSFQVPATPGTSAWPPRRPSVPTSRATRVTSAAKERSWSTIVLMVDLSSSISPWAFTVIFWDRSPCATAVVTSATLRTWSVRLRAMKFTLSVRSFQVPATPGTSAWPPSAPSVPTSRATRVTSLANACSWATIALTIEPMRANSPRNGWPSMVSAIFWERSPSATAAMTRATSVVGRTRSSTSPLTAPRAWAQPPSTPSSGARSVMRPSRPMTWAIRVSSAVSAALRATSALNAVPASPAGPPARESSRTAKSPAAAARRASRRSRSAVPPASWWSVRAVPAAASSVMSVPSGRVRCWGVPSHSRAPVARERRRGGLFGRPACPSLPF
ncbi:MAG: hypothetical protein AVDCRST_MAG13-871 [uncultured Solirubrobacteraceae bacterium]|uniref:Uncharacterized protein n=1 Tax=uncultured Solirubrobacteraceae bacterium TaxID=1162706 RepID=A0A6J4RLH6_9ACTN|nr:MAG: hypothetical protein AVDCRST_MAG13-871 [uncultured Solirubrobacteraceae bacterium]